MKLKEFRLNKGLTQEQMAKLVGISKSMYEIIEYEERKPSIDTMKKSKEVFKDLDINIFLT